MTKEDLELEREFLLEHLKRLETKWNNSDRSDERIAARHFGIILLELKSGVMLNNAKILQRVRKLKSE